MSGKEVNFTKISETDDRRIQRGTPWTLRMTVSGDDAIADVAMDVRTRAGALIVGWRSDDDPPEVHGECTVVGRVVTCSLTEELTATLDAGSYVYDTFMEIGGDKARVIFGVVQIVERVSNPL